MTGGWYGVLGIDFLHLKSALLEVENILDPAPAIVMGGNICLGAKDDCSMSFSTKTLEVYAYVGLAPEAPMRSWFMVMINELTVRRILFLMESHTSIEQQTSNLPDRLLDTGFYPLKDPSQCQDNSNRETIDTDCYVMMSYTSEKHEIPLGRHTLVVKQGLEVKGVLDIAGWEVKVDLRVSRTLVSIDVEMDHIAVTFGGPFTFLELGKYLVDGQAEGGPQFILQAGLVDGHPTALVQINGALTINLLHTYAMVEVVLDSDLFRFNSEIALFGGAWNTKALVEWNWDLTYLRVRLGGVSFLWVTFGELEFVYPDDLDDFYDALFSSSISVFGFAAVEGRIGYKYEGDLQVIEFRLADRGRGVGEGGDCYSTCQLAFRGDRADEAVRYTVSHQGRGGQGGSERGA
eukprot:Sspe_Gene.55787::Locus_30676_Transcript_1_1_Confidence_1.000_Length_2426::g.55787::m.55787